MKLKPLVIAMITLVFTGATTGPGMAAGNGVERGITCLEEK